MEQLYENLMALSNDDATPFYHVDQERYGDSYRVFSYHFTDKDSWLKPDALESRGIMFEMDGETPVRLACRTPHKFFNKNEVNFIEYGQPQIVMNKVDGSLISSFTDSNGELRLKSKTSIQSEYADAAMELLNQNMRLYHWIIGVEMAGYTVNLEYVSPDPKHRIVVHYPEARLVVLNARHRTSGEYMPFEHIPAMFFAGREQVSVLDELDNLTNAEGYVVIDDKGNWWKEKGNWYVKLHAHKSNITLPKSLYTLVVNEQSDDIKELFKEDQYTIDTIEEMERHVSHVANGVFNRVHAFYNENKGLERKEYALLGQNNLSKDLFSLAMMLYSGKEIDLKQFMIKQYELYKLPE